VLLIIAGYILYSNYNKGKKPKKHYGSSPYVEPRNHSPFSSSMENTQRRQQPQLKSPYEDSTKSRSEMELEKSLKEAKKLLGGK